jgi:hypothetical protein
MDASDRIKTLQNTLRGGGRPQWGWVAHNRTDRRSQDGLGCRAQLSELCLPRLLEQYHPDWNREAAQGDEIAREWRPRALPVRLETL